MPGPRSPRASPAPPPLAEEPSESPDPVESGFATARLASDVLRRLSDLIRRGDVGRLTPLATGFQPLDRYLDGGLRPGELVLIGGAQGVGKTTLTMQMARNLVVQSQATCGYVCYEHDDTFLAQRLIALESLIGRGKVDPEAVAVTDLRDLILSAGRSSDVLDGGGLDLALAQHPSGLNALSRIQTFGRRLYLMKASSSATDVAALRRLVRSWKEQHGPRVVLFLDYMQKIPVFPTIADEGDRVTELANSLKELALSEEVPVVAVVAADREGLRAQRLRIHHLRGSSSLMYEADIVLIMNNKYRIVARHSITFNPHRAQEFRAWVVCTIEKNRSGRELVDVEFRSHFAHAGFDPSGFLVSDQLIDERIHEE